MLISRPALVRIILFLFFLFFLGLLVFFSFVWKEVCLFDGVFGGILCKIDLFLVGALFGSLWFDFFGSFFLCSYSRVPAAERICSKIDDERASLFVIATPFALGYGFPA